MEKKWTIGEMAKLFDVSADALRYCFRLRYRGARVILRIENDALGELIGSGDGYT